MSPVPPAALAVDVDHAVLRICRDEEVFGGSHVDISLIVHRHVVTHIHVDRILAGAHRSVFGVDNGVEAGSDVLFPGALLRIGSDIGYVAVGGDGHIAVFGADLTEAGVTLNLVEVDVPVFRLGIQAHLCVLDVLADPVVADRGIHDPVAVLILVHGTGLLAAGCLVCDLCGDRGCVVTLLQIQRVPVNVQDVAGSCQIHVGAQDILGCTVFADGSAQKAAVLATNNWYEVNNIED